MSKKLKVNGRPPHVPTDEFRYIVIQHAQGGTDEATIAKILGVSLPTLVKYYQKELEGNIALANSVIMGKLYEKALKGDTACMMFWLKTRARWSEVQKIEHSGQIDSETKMIVLPSNSREFDIDMKVEAIESKDNDEEDESKLDDDTDYPEN